MIPSMWRVELFHPLTVHLPIGVLLAATGLRLLALVLAKWRPEWSRQLEISGRTFTVVGAAVGWAAYVTGNLAEEEVNGLLCDPTATHRHGDLALYVTVFFSVVAGFDLAAWLVKSEGRARSVLRSSRFAALLALASVLGAIGLGYVGHMGASLVYQQGAAVYKPSEECTEFSE
jgi:uncharacterized membrane protein